ncbi:hypothetical protein PR048_031840, partial [Dryococelus australis]
MSRNDFYDLAELKNGLMNTSKKTHVSGVDLKFADTIFFRFEESSPWGMKPKHRMNIEFEEFMARKIRRQLPKCSWQNDVFTELPLTSLVLSVSTMLIRLITPGVDVEVS